MFFLGISAHLFMYLLFPTLVIIWFYFKGVAGSPETIVSFPEKVEYSYSITDPIEKISSCHTLKKTIQQKIYFDIATFLNRQFYHDASIVYLQPIFQYQVLRAPPFAI